MKTVLVIRADTPNTVGRSLTLPQGILYLAETIGRKGGCCSLLDTSVTTNWRKWDGWQLLTDALYVGISSFSGPALRVAMDVAQHVRRLDPQAPIVWGGVHASLCPESTLASGLCDAVVCGDGEQVVDDLHYSGARPAGIYRAEKYTPLDTIGNLPYHKLPLHAYGVVGGTFPYHSSRGCSHRCTFCCGPKRHGAQWRAQSADVVIDRVSHIVREYHPHTIHFTDDNFFVSASRAEAICHMWRNDPLLSAVKWKANVRLDFAARQPVEWWRMVKASGCVRVGPGVEAGSDKLLAQIRKGETVDEIVAGAQHLAEAGIETNSCTYVYGFPGEKEDDLSARFYLMDRLDAIGRRTGTPVVNAGMFGLTLYPGCEATEQAVALGAKVPTTLEGWSQPLGDTPRFPWLSRRYLEIAATASAIGRFRYFEALGAIDKLRSPAARAIVKALAWFLRTSASVRWPRRWFRWAPEWAAFAWVCKRILGQT